MNEYSPRRRLSGNLLLLSVCNGILLSGLQIFNLLVGQMEETLRISDVDISLLQGFAFGAVGAITSLPAARISDHGRQKTVIAAAAIVWSIGNAICAMAGCYWQLLVGRACVGIGEAAYVPAAISLLSLLVPQHRRAFAMGVFVSGATVGSSGAWLLGGWGLSHVSWLGSLIDTTVVIVPWRVLYGFFALSGIAALALIGAVQPPPRQPSGRRPGEEAILPIRELWRSCGEPVIGVLFAVVSLSFGGAAMFMWLPTILARTDGFGVGAAGELLGFSYLVWCSGGASLAGALADSWRMRGRSDSALLLLGLSGLLTAAGLCGMAAAHDHPAIVVLSLALALGSGAVGSAMGPLALAEVTPLQSRAQFLSLQYFFIYLISVSLGPASAAMLNERLFAGPNSVGWAVFVVSSFSAFGTAGAILWCRNSFVATAQDLARRG